MNILCAMHRGSMYFSVPASQACMSLKVVPSACYQGYLPGSMRPRAGHLSTVRNPQGHAKPSNCRFSVPLQDSVERGAFLRELKRPEAGPRVPMMVAVALDIARAIEFLHSHGIVHGGAARTLMLSLDASLQHLGGQSVQLVNNAAQFGPPTLSSSSCVHAHTMTSVCLADLSGGNVMLRTAGDCQHGVTAKVADFGLSRIMDVQSRMQTRMYGTVRVRRIASNASAASAVDPAATVISQSSQSVRSIADHDVRAGGARQATMLPVCSSVTAAPVLCAAGDACAARAHPGRHDQQGEQRPLAGVPSADIWSAHAVTSPRGPCWSLRGSCAAPLQPAGHSALAVCHSVLRAACSC